MSDMVSKETIANFKYLYETKFNVLLTDEEATQMSTDLINLMKILVEPDNERSEDETITTRV